MIKRHSAAVVIFLKEIDLRYKAMSLWKLFKGIDLGKIMKHQARSLWRNMGRRKGEAFLISNLSPWSSDSFRVSRNFQQSGLIGCTGDFFYDTGGTGS